VKPLLILALEHLYLATAGVFLATLVGVPLGILLTHYRRLAPVVFSLTEMVQTVPSLGLLALLLFVFGLGNKTLIAGLLIYSLLPIVRNTYTGIRSIRPELIEAGKGMGMTRLQLLTQVELPIALPVVLGGIRVALITAIGISTIGVVIGTGGLGQPIWRGIQMENQGMIIQGAATAAALAILAEILLTALEQRITPRGLRKRKAT
jgi:osmoprotectant transport system permease protein